MKLLIIEDDQFFGQQIKELIEDRGGSVISAMSAQEALSIPVEDVDAAIIDVMLPNDPASSGITNEESRGGFQTGICVARRLRAKSARIRIVLLSSYADRSDVRIWAQENGVALLGKDEGRNRLLGVLEQIGLTPRKPPCAFIVHGHDESSLLHLKDYLQNTLKWQEPVVLRDLPSAGRTVIEKFEEYASQADCVFVLLTPDDITIGNGTNDEKRRSRQNVIFELGFFYAVLGRRSGRVILLHKGPVELPSDIAGVIWIDISAGIKSAGEEIRREIAVWAEQ